MLPSHNTLTPHEFEADGLEASGSAILSTPLESTVNELDNHLKELSQSINEEKSKLEESVLLASELIHAVNKALQFLYICSEKGKKGKRKFREKA